MTYLNKSEKIIKFKPIVVVLVSGFCFLILSLLIFIRGIDGYLINHSSKEDIIELVAKKYQTKLNYDEFILRKQLNNYYLKISNLLIKNDKFAIVIKDLEIDYWIFNNWLGGKKKNNIVKSFGLDIQLFENSINSPQDKIKEREWFHWNFNALETIVNLSQWFTSYNYIDVELIQNRFSIGKNWYVDMPFLYYESLLLEERLDFSMDLISKLFIAKNLNFQILRKKTDSNPNWLVNSSLSSIKSQHIPFDLTLEDSVLNGIYDEKNHQFSGQLDGVFNQAHVLSSRVDLKTDSQLANIVEILLSEATIDDVKLGFYRVNLNNFTNKLFLSSNNKPIKSLDYFLEDFLKTLNIKGLSGNIDFFEVEINLTDESISYLFFRGKNMGFTSNINDRQVIRGVNLDVNYKNSITHLKIHSPTFLFNLPIFQQLEVPLVNFDIDLQLNGTFEKPEELFINQANFTVNDKPITFKGKAIVADSKVNLSLRSDTLKLNNLKYIISAIPNDFVNEPVKNWVENNLIEGSLNETIINMQFPVEEFFHSSLSVTTNFKFIFDKMKIKPYTDWENIFLHHAELSFENNTFHTVADSAETENTKIKLDNVNLKIFTDNKQVLLSLKSHLNSRNSQVQTYIKQSPFFDSINLFDLFNLIDFAGNISASLDLLLPLGGEYYKPSNKQNNIHQINLNFNIEKGQLKFQDHILKNISGKLQIDKNGINIGHLSGKHNHSPVLVDFFRKENSLNIPFKISYDINKWTHLDAGITTLTGTVILLKDGSVEISANADLSHLNIKLPFQITNTQNKSLEIDINILLNKNLENYSITLNKGFGTFDYLFDRAKNKTLYANIQLGNSQHQLIQDGVQVVLNIPSIDISKWTLFMSKLFKKKKDSFDWRKYNLKHIAIKTEKFNWGRLELDHLSFIGGYLPDNNKKIWKANLTSTQTQGSFVWDKNSIDIYIDKINLQKSNLKENEAKTFIPYNPIECSILPLIEVPTINIKLDQFIYNKINYGELSANGSMNQRQLNFASIQMQTTETKIIVKDFKYQEIEKIKNVHINTAENYKTSGKVEIQSNSLATLLNPFYAENSVYQANDVLLDGQLQWQGSPWCLQKDNIQGKLKFETKEGVFKNVEPGLAQLLALLNFKILFERLGKSKELIEKEDKLDKIGMAFQKLQGKIKFNNEIVEFSPLRVDSPIAVIDLDGHLNSVQNKYDFSARIKPELAPTIVTLSTLFGGPITGLTSLLATEILNVLKLDDKFFTYTLKLKGDFEATAVE